MNCDEAHHQIVLWVGGDLEESAVLPVERHVTACPHCRCALEDLRVSHEALTSLRAASTRAASSLGEKEPAPSLWPAVSRRLAWQQPELQRPRFNGWIPGLAVSVACLAVMVVAVRNVADAPMSAPPRFEFHEERLSPADFGAHGILRPRFQVDQRTPDLLRLPYQPQDGTPRVWRIDEPFRFLREFP